MALTTIVHIFAGGMDIYAPLRDSSLPLDVLSVLSVVWHMVTIILGVFAVTLFWLSFRYNVPLAIILGLCQLGFAVAFLIYGLVDFQNITAMPQWIAFIVIPGLMGLGHRSQS